MLTFARVTYSFCTLVGTGTTKAGRSRIWRSTSASIPSNLDTLHWMLKKEIRWWGMDTGSCDHAMNTSICRMRPDLADEFTRKHGKTPAEYFGTFEYTHKKSGRRVQQDMFPFHSWAFQEGLLHAEISAAISR